MSEKLIKKNSKVYVLCPAYEKTGGPELLHQLVNELNNNNIEAYITYYNFNEKNDKYTHKDYKKYVNTYKTITDIQDNDNNVVISPEVIDAIKLTKNYKYIKKVIWWLSVDNYLGREDIRDYVKYLKRIHPIFIFYAPIWLIKKKILGRIINIKNFDKHFCQSHYAINFLEKKGITDSIYLSDYISDEYLESSIDYNRKKNIVVYNPSKGIQFTKKIINKAPHLMFVPIKNLTTNEVKELLLESKVYIDFGNHPGKDRLPREAANCGCCIITSKKGSAKFQEDVPINEEFKFKDDDNNLINIINKIDNCIENYDAEIIKFKNYRKFIKQEKQNFKIDVKKIFCE